MNSAHTTPAEPWSCHAFDLAHKNREFETCPHPVLLGEYISTGVQLCLGIPVYEELSQYWEEYSHQNHQGLSVHQASSSSALPGTSSWDSIPRGLGRSLTGGNSVSCRSDGEGLG